MAYIVFACLASAQTPDTAIIHGEVTDPTHAAAPGVTVKVKNTQLNLERTVQTDAGGAFVVEGLPVAGAYEITASKQGFADAQLSDVHLQGGTTATLSLQLSVAGGKSAIEVTGITGEVHTDQPQIGIDLTTRDVQELPLQNDRITYLPLLNAANRQAINQGDVFMNEDLFTTNGAGRRQAWFEVDGATGNDSWGRQTIFSNLPADAVEEMKVLVNAFSAEYGGSTGSAVNIVTRSGGSTFHGGIYGNFRPGSTSAKLSGFTTSNAASGNDIAEDQLWQSGLDVSGPLSGHTQFFFAGEDTLENRASPVVSPIAPGNFVGHYRGWLALVRVDHQINDRNTLFYRGNLDGFYDTNPNGIVGGNSLPTVARTFRRRTYSNDAGETAILSPTLVNSLRLQFQLASPITEFDPVIYGTQYSVPISTGGTFTSGTSQNALLLNRQYQAADTLAASWGRHQVKFGEDMIFSHTGGNSKEFGGPSYLGVFTYNTCTLALAVCESPTFLNNLANVKTYAQSYGNANYTVNDTLWALFVQDDFHARKDLTINLGLRYERQTFTDAAHDFAPRVGFSYNVNGDGKTVIRGGFGIYYSQIVDNSQANYALTGPTGVFNYTASPGQIGFPTSVAAVPLPAFPAGAQAPLRSLYIRPGMASYYNQFFPTNTLIGYQSGLLNPYSEQWSVGVERRLGGRWVLAVDYVGAHTLRIVRPLDVDPPSSFIRTAPGQVRTAQAANCTRPYWIWWYQQNNAVCNPNTATNPQPPYSIIQSDVNNGYLYYDALDVNLSHSFSSKLSMLISYTWSHTIDNVDPDTTSQNPNDPLMTGRIENGNAIFDQRQRLVVSGVYNLPFKINFGGVATLASGLPYNYVTGANNSGDSVTDRPVINGVVVGRNIGRGHSIYDIAPFVERTFGFGEHWRLLLRAEAFNVFNHANFVGYSGTWGNGATAGAGFGAPLVGITNQLPARSLQFSGRVSF